MNIKATWLLSFLLFLSLSVVAQKEKKVEIKDLPEKAQVFIKKNFTKENVQYVLNEAGEILENGYNVIFKNKVKIKFDKKGDWKKVDGNRKPIPTNFIPEKILSYIKRSFPNNFVVKIEREKKKYEVEISNGLELEFDKEGNFLKID